MQSVFLIGFMGSGKSSVCTCLADRLKWKAKDTDHEIELYYEETIPQIFATKGEDVFRTYESHILKQMPITNTVIATGGGIIGKAPNREWMKKHGIVIYLHASWNEIKRRLADDTQRPLWKDTIAVQALFKSRLPLYEETSHYQIQTDQKTVDAITEEIISLINTSING
ncbi:shikimate kinase [Radiobacillus deserti]|uniref:Shikimate kinase n=1 Tax=Radiobacillus deserti TaxID=2594883 RepID=A0A516KGQ3_9BACI|nr:shikimate kinase [Radiobacillus deserti]QDP40588.1 shikimate kinase [Radiobacillus deserti]